jgi:hypothetical protein
VDVDEVYRRSGRQWLSDGWGITYVFVFFPTCVVDVHKPYIRWCIMPGIVELYNLMFSLVEFRPESVHVLTKSEARQLQLFRGPRAPRRIKVAPRHDIRVLDATSGSILQQ